MTAKLHFAVKGSVTDELPKFYRVSLDLCECLRVSSLLLGQYVLLENVLELYFICFIKVFTSCILAM